MMTTRSASQAPIVPCAYALVVLLSSWLLSCEQTPDSPLQPSGVTIFVTPSAVTVAPGESVTFQAQVNGSNDAQVLWKVKEGNAGGVITLSGSYLAPPAEGRYTVVAQLADDPTVTAEAQVDVFLGDGSVPSDGVTCNEKLIETAQYAAQGAGAIQILSVSPASPANNNTPVVYGSAPPFTKIRVYSNPQCAGDALGSGCTNSAGFFYVKVPVEDNSSTVFYASGTSPSGEAVPCSSSFGPYIEDSISPLAPVLNVPGSVVPSRELFPTLTGTAEADSTVRIYDNATCSGASYGNATATSGNFSIKLTTPVTDNATSTLYAKAFDAAGNGSPCSSTYVTYQADSLPPNAPLLATTSPLSPANNNAPSLIGTAEALVNVRIYSNSSCSGSQVASTTANGSGAFSVTLSVLDNSTNVFFAKAIDLAGNMSPCSFTYVTYIEDSIGPPAPTVSSVLPVSPSNVGTPTVSGLAAPSVTVKIFGNSACSGSALGSGAASANGAFSVAATVPENASSVLYAAAEDASGNRSACSTTFVSYIEDSTPPSMPVVLSVSPSSPANANSPTISGQAEAGTLVRLYTDALCSTLAKGLTTATAQGTFQVSPTLALSDNSTTVFYASSTDNAGNESVCSATSVSFVEDSAAPTVSSRTPGSSATTISALSPVVVVFSENMKQSTINGSSFTLKAGSSVSGSVATTANSATFTPSAPLQLGTTYTVTLESTITDLAGNALTKTEWTFTTKWPTSCLALKEAGNNSDGTYSIDLDGPGPGGSQTVYCDMTTDGGGWTLFGNVTSVPFVYGSTISSQVGISNLNANVIGSKPANSMARMRVEGSGFHFDLRQAQWSEAFAPSSSSGFTSLQFDTVLSQTNADIRSEPVSGSHLLPFFGVTQTGYLGGSLVAVQGGHQSRIGSTTYNTCSSGKCMGLSWVLNQSAANGYTSKNSLDLSRFSAAGQNQSTGNVATSLRLYWRESPAQGPNCNAQTYPTTDLAAVYDATQSSSYPRSGSTWTNLATGQPNASLTSTTYRAANLGLLSFDGASSYADFDVSSVSGTLTIELWAKIHTINGGTLLGGDLYAIATGSDAKGLYFTTGNSDAYGLTKTQTTALGLEGQWKHYVFEMRADASYALNRLYINGVQASLSQLSGTESSANRTFNSGQLRLSGTRTSNSGRIAMDVGVMRLYLRSLTPTEITQQFNAMAGCYGAQALETDPAGCSANGCPSLQCNMGWADCDGSAANGCETYVYAINNCGACGQACSLANVASQTCDYPVATCLVGSCAAGYANCSGDASAGCATNILTDVSNCGSCSNVCSFANAVAGCSNGACALSSCLSGFGNCDSNASNGCEVNVLSSTSHCGACGSACVFSNASGLCNNGACAIVSCNAGFASCDSNAANGCEVNIATSTSNCGSCGNVCSYANATALCTSGACSLGSCNVGYGNCDSNSANGCEVNTRTSVSHCGACGNACNLANATPGCTNGACTVTACSSGFGNCDNNAANGCETNTRTSTSHCGACGAACNFANGSGSCSNGTCVLSSCNAGFANCDGNAANGCETNTRTSASHCGACGAACSYANGAGACSNGTCSLAACNSGWGNCDGSAANGCETNTNSSMSHCGGCGNYCSISNGGGTCTNGSCQVSFCQVGWADCNGSSGDGCEADLSSTSHCGGCYNQCSFSYAFPACMNGSCEISGCESGFANCDGAKWNGCEVNTNNSSSNCGACGNTCGSNSSCSVGSCVCGWGWGSCDGNSSNGCETSLTTLTDCGGCGNECYFYMGAASCSTGSCQLTGCSNPTFYDNCDGNPANGCEASLTNDEANCGACGNVCSPPNATGVCLSRSCNILSCNIGYRNCDGDINNGCETFGNCP